MVDLPMEPAYPAALLRKVIDDAQPVAIITADQMRARLPDTKYDRIAFTKNISFFISFD
jgi:non-ribosomal peptide synthetase component F